MGEPEVPTRGISHPNGGAFEPLAPCAAELLHLSAGCAVLMKCSVLVVVRRCVTHDKKWRIVRGKPRGGLHSSVADTNPADKEPRREPGGE